MWKTDTYNDFICRVPDFNNFKEVSHERTYYNSSGEKVLIIRRISTDNLPHLNLVVQNFTQQISNTNGVEVGRVFEKTQSDINIFLVREVGFDIYYKVELYGNYSDMEIRLFIESFDFNNSF